ncbi:hypothetical protein, partial [Vibrio sp. 10N.222.49.C9]|uniref:hypothetical protein n=1 Tax=Vibrio sp. 10N.222.49.C9 TaxID=3229615 RepID=UPI00354E6E90
LTNAVKAMKETLMAQKEKQGTPVTFCEKRRKRMFRKVKHLFKSQVDAEPTSRFEANGSRVIEYLDCYFQMLGKPNIDELSEDDVVLVQSGLNAESADYSLAYYVGEIIKSYIAKTEPKVFEGLKCKCVCGGMYSLNRNHWNYRCDECGLLGRSDMNGIPESLPASKEVRERRNQLHRRMETILDSGFVPWFASYGHLYDLVSYHSGIPKGYCHIGWLTTVEQVESFDAGLSAIQRQSASASLGL